MSWLLLFVVDGDGDVVVGVVGVVVVVDVVVGKDELEVG